MIRAHSLALSGFLVELSSNFFLLIEDHAACSSFYEHCLFARRCKTTSFILSSRPCSGIRSYLLRKGKNVKCFLAYSLQLVPGHKYQSQAKKHLTNCGPNTVDLGTKKQ